MEDESYNYFLYVETLPKQRRGNLIRLGNLMRLTKLRKLRKQTLVKADVYSCHVNRKKNQPED